MSVIPDQKCLLLQCKSLSTNILQFKVYGTTLMCKGYATKSSAYNNFSFAVMLVLIQGLCLKQEVKFG